MRRILPFYIILLFVLNLSPVVPSSPVSNGDKLIHFMEFLILGFMVRGDPKFLIFPILLETGQMFIPPSLFDMGTNLIGFGFGYLVRWVWNESRDRGVPFFHEGRD